MVVNIYFFVTFGLMNSQLHMGCEDPQCTLGQHVDNDMHESRICFQFSLVSFRVGDCSPALESELMSTAGSTSGPKLVLLPDALSNHITVRSVLFCLQFLVPLIETPGRVQNCL